jgi:phage shock protein A
MKPIEGVSIANELEKIYNEFREEKIKNVSKQLRGIAIDLDNWYSAKEKLLKELDSVEKKIANAKAKIDKIKAEDWSVLADLKEAENDKKSSAGPTSNM